MTTTVPLPVAEAAALSGRLDAAVLAPYGRQVGRRVEVDLEALEAAGAQEAAGWMARYWERCEAFWDEALGGGSPGEYWVLRRRLLAAAQSDSQATGRVDLRDELEALRRIGGLGAVTEVLCAAELDVEELTRRAGPYTPVVDHEGDTTTVTLVVCGDHDWPEALGGAASYAEIARRVTLVARRAPWRDRRVRRLVSVTVEVDEVWPDPSGVE